MTTSREEARLERIIWDKVPGTDESFPTRAAQDILSEFVVIPRTDLPEVTEHGHGNLRVGESNYSSMLRIEKARTSALECLALAEYIEARESGRTKVEAKRVARRDELAKDLSKYGDPYHSLSDGLRRAIDRIIELEEAAA